MEQASKTFMAENTVFLLLTALIRNFYKAIMQRIEVKLCLAQGNQPQQGVCLQVQSPVPAKWIKTARQHVLNIHTGKSCSCRSSLKT